MNTAVDRKTTDRTSASSVVVEDNDVVRETLLEVHQTHGYAAEGVAGVRIA